MKKIIIILALIVLASISLKAQFIPKLAFDYFPETYKIKAIQNVPAALGTNEMSAIVQYSSYRIRMGGEYKFNAISAYFNQYIYMDKAQGIAFSPTQAEWYVGLKYEIKKGVHINLEHACYHPVLTDKRDIQARVYGGYSMVSINYNY